MTSLGLTEQVTEQAGSRLIDGKYYRPLPTGQTDRPFRPAGADRPIRPVWPVADGLHRSLHHNPILLLPCSSPTKGDGGAGAPVLFEHRVSPGARLLTLVGHYGVTSERSELRCLLSTSA